MSCGYRHHQSLPYHFFGLQKNILNRRTGKADIDLAALQCLDLIATVNVFEVELNLGKGKTKDPQCTGQNVVHRGTDKADRDRPGFAGGRLTDLIGDLIRLPKQPSSLTE